MLREILVELGDMGERLSYIRDTLLVLQRAIPYVAEHGDTWIDAPIKARLYFGHAVEDSTATPEQVATLEGALRDWHGAFQSEVYEGAKHGWTVPGRDVYNELQAERAFEKEVELFDIMFDFASEEDRQKVRGRNALKLYKWTR